MTEEREEIKGKLLLLWLDDLRNERTPGIYPETASLAQPEIEEVMSLARFVKATIYPSETPSTSFGEYASKVAEQVLRELDRREATNKTLVAKAASFGELLHTAITSQEISREALLVSLGLPASTLAEIESGRLPPHRLPADRMVRLLTALRLAFRDIVEVIKKSSLQWASAEYSRSQTQLGRLDVAIPGEEREKLMEDRDSLDKETERIERYCSELSNILP